MKNTTPIRHSDALANFERLDQLLLDWSRQRGGRETGFGALIHRETLDAAEYPAAFPHLLLGVSAATDATTGLAHSQSLTDWRLAPAVCYHVYAELAGTVLEAGRVIAARGSCFRFEDPAQLALGRRQIEFQMRELVFVGDPAWLETQLTGVEDEVAALAAACALHGDWAPASDPFFLPTAGGKAVMQKLSGVKREFCLADGLAIASVNRHRDFFGQRFSIQLADGRPAQSACVAFGLDRWHAHSHS